MSAFIDGLLAAASRVTNWRLTLGLKKSSKDSIGLLLPPKSQEAQPEDRINPRARGLAAREITYALTGFHCIDPRASFMTVPCSSDVHLHFDPERNHCVLGAYFCFALLYGSSLSQDKLLITVTA
ncbi:unnamed protein product [Dibothriocephalus latus]|uniref:Uncharacterized protein n=1 Tax=Dibothriocephalus latus TaxID=60516 RepID=A0A3P7LZ86_DIBLA|nr:unnamed protein product [Dibothriocephalus latus]